MPTFPTADTPAGSTHKQAAAKYDPATRQHLAEYVEAAYAAAGMAPSGLAGYGGDGDDDLQGGDYTQQQRRRPAAAEEEETLPHTLFQRYDTGRDVPSSSGLGPPAAKRPRPSGGF